MKISIVILVIIGVGLSGQGVSQTVTDETHGTSVRETELPDLSKKASLSTYLKYAALNNAGLEAAFNHWKAELERIPQVKALPDPRFSYSYFIEEVETRVGPQKQKFEVSQTFPWFGTLGLKEDMAAESADAARQRYEAAKLKLFYAVKKNYYEYYYLARAIAITKKNIRLLSELEAVARVKFKASSARHSSVIKAQVELGRLQDRFQTLQDFQAPLIAKLNAALNRPLKSDLPWPTAIPDFDTSMSEGELFAIASSSNPELRAMEHLAKKESSGVKLAGKSYYPNIMLGAGLIETGDANMPEMDESGKDPIIAMIAISLPIWPGKSRAGVREAKAREMAAQEHLKESKNNLLADVELALYHFRDAERKITLYRDGLIPKAWESLEVNNQAFESGKAEFLDVIDSERVLLEFELSYERALVNRAQRLAELEMLIGRELSKDSSKKKKDNITQDKTLKTTK
jgi:outer membrane protein TolC